MSSGKPTTDLELGRSPDQRELQVTEELSVVDDINDLQQRIKELKKAATLILETLTERDLLSEKTVTDLTTAVNIVVKEFQVRIQRYKDGTLTDRKPTFDSEELQKITEAARKKIKNQ